MIIYYLLTGVFTLVGALTSFLPTSTTLPVIGVIDTDAMVKMGLDYFRSLMLFFPLFQVVFQAFLYYVFFRIIMLTLRLFRIIR